MRREVYWYQRAAEEIAQLAARNARQSTRILMAVRDLGQTGRGDLKKLQGNGDWRLRVGDWRVFLVFVENFAYVSAIRDRQDAYS